MVCTRGSRQSPALVQQLVVRPLARAASPARAGASTVAFTTLAQPGAGIVAPGSLRVSTSATSTTGQTSPTGGRVNATATATSHFQVGQCTWWADRMRPDIFKAAVAHGVPTGSANTPYPWAAWRWAQNARVGGLPVGSVPQVGAIAVFPRGSWGSSVGHVAYVEAVYQGSYQISEENFGPGEDAGGRIDGDDPDARLRTIYTSGHANDSNRNPPGTEFIYRMPASGPTTSAPQGPTTTAPSVTPTPVSAIKWRDRTYTARCAGLTASSVTAAVHNGRGVAAGVQLAPGGGAEDVELLIRGVAIGDLTGDGIPEAAVLILCHPVLGGPTNFVDEVQVFSAGPHLLARLDPPPLAHSNYGFVPIFVPFSTFSISAGVLNTSVDAWSGTDAHADPSVRTVVRWHWNGTSFTPSTSSGTTPAQPQNRVTLDGYGQLQLGMTLAEATAAVGPIQLTYRPASCGDGQMPGAPNGVTVMFLHGRLARIDIGSAGVLTLSGIGVGSSAADVTRTYPGSITVRPAPLRMSRMPSGTSTPPRTPHTAAAKSCSGSISRG